MNELIIGTTHDGAPFALPRDAATQKLAFLARSGAGKTYAAARLAEAMHAAQIPLVVLDPVGVWYGLRRTEMYGRPTGADCHTPVLA